ncbi:hypothetical protein L3V86_00140 [Thiotrichales bacterium 19S11-10]|nr:hypothetical protein [Thiotrichales bacterium 19S11-10]
MIQSKHLLDELDFTKVVKSIVENDRLHFKKHSDLYYQNPITAIKQSLNELETNPIWLENWSLFIDTMVYGEHPSYQVAIKNLKTLSEIAINAINKKSNN